MSTANLRGSNFGIQEHQVFNVGFANVGAPNIGLAEPGQLRRSASPTRATTISALLTPAGANIGFANTGSTAISASGSPAPVRSKVRQLQLGRLQHRRFSSGDGNAGPHFNSGAGNVGIKHALNFGIANSGG